MANQPASSEQTQYLGFHIAGEEYAIGILRVREILEYDTVTKVPTTPRSIRGVINLRGSVVPVIDLAVKFGLPESAITKRSCVVVVDAVIEGEGMVLGLLTDAVSQVIDLPPSEIEPPPSFGTRVRVECLLGMGRAGKKFVLLVDIDRLLSNDEVAAAQTVADGDPASVLTEPAAIDAAGGTEPTTSVAGAEGLL